MQLSTSAHLPMAGNPAQSLVARPLLLYKRTPAGAPALGPFFGYATTPSDRRVHKSRKGAGKKIVQARTVCRGGTPHHLHDTGPPWWQQYWPGSNNRRTSL